MKINPNSRVSQNAQNTEVKKAEKKAQDELVIEGTEDAGEVSFDFEEYDQASATDLFAAAASNYSRKRSTYVDPEIAAIANQSTQPPPPAEGQLKATLEKISKRLSDLPPAKPLKYRG